MPAFDTASGGTISLDISRDGLTGQRLWMEIDQSSNINNTDDSSSVIITNDEVKNLIDLLHDYIRFTENKDYFKKISDIEDEEKGKLDLLNGV